MNLRWCSILVVSVALSAQVGCKKTAPAVKAKQESRKIDPAARYSAALELLKDEAIGRIKLGMTADAVTLVLGPPSEETPTNKDPVTEEMFFTRAWKPEGLFVVFYETEGIMTVRTITLAEETTVSTQKGIHIDSTRRQLDAAYEAGRMFNPEFPNSDVVYIVGNNEHGMTFWLANNKVLRVYWN
jgi:hypothetical protein